jgi:nucleotide-binding universal stress UspA family protein
MFKHILVPLDGSHLAEAALPAAAYLAGVAGANVTLFHVIEQNPPSAVHGEHHLTQPEEANRYLDELTHKAFPANLHVDQHVHTDQVRDVAGSIVKHAGEFAPDLIVMCAHGRGGLRDFLIGSIPQQVIAQSSIPVLLIQPDGSGQADFNCRTILVPMDTRPEHRAGLALAAEIAKNCAGNLVLLHVVPTMRTLSGQNAAAGMLMPGAMTALLDLNEQEAAAYLRDQASSVSSLTTCSATFVKRGDPVGVIAEFGLQIKAGMIVLGTHGKVGSDAFWAGSVAPKLPAQTKIPLLFVPVQGTD